MMLRDEERQNLLTEYQILQNEISRRSRANLTLGSILVPSSVVIMAVAIEFRESLNAIFPFEINASGFVPLFSGLLLFASWLFSYRTRKIKEICYMRMNEIETMLGIEGHKYIHLRVQSSWYYRIWTIIWFLLFLLTFTISIITSIMLFLEVSS